jgi:hypothetical protein
VERLCAETASHIDRREADLAARLRPTIVEFEELD